MNNKNVITIDELRKMISGYSRTQELYTTVKLGIPDQLATGPKNAEEMAKTINAHPQSLYRFLRLLVARGFIKQERDNRFSLTKSGDLLRSDHPNSLNDLIIYTGEFSYRIGQGMFQSIKTGEAGFNLIFGESFFDYLDQNPHLRKLFNKLSGENAIERANAVVDTYDFSGEHVIIDVGGGNGTLIATILKAFPKNIGIIFESPNVIQESKHFLAKNSLANKSKVISGDFFTNQIPKGDIIILSNIIHDWDNSNAIKILRNCRSSMDTKSRMLIIEQIMPEHIEDGSAVVGSDITMLMLLNGAERTRTEYDRLLAQADLTINALIPFSPTKILPNRKPSWAIIECIVRKTPA